MKIRLFIVAIVSALVPLEADADVTDSISNIYDFLSRGFEDAWPDEFDAEGWEVDLGAGTAVVPEYAGADRYKIAALPLVRVSYDGFLSLRNTKLRVNLLRYENFSAGAVARYSFGRDESGDQVLEGLGNIGDTMEIGGFVRYSHKYTTVKLELREAVSEGQGRTAYLSVNQGLHRSGKLKVGLLASAIFGSGKKMQSYFGVTDEQSATSIVGLRPYDAGGGLYQTDLFLGGEYSLTSHWLLGALVGYSRLLNDAANSPIVADFGSPNMLSAGIGLFYRF
jgi:outer membrane scaffolding protein for murein synthesis (MipA/OmpV family)